MIKNKYIKILIIFISIIILLFIIKIIINGNTRDNIKNYIESNGYILNSDNIYEKRNSSLTKEDYDYYVKLGSDASYSIDTFDQNNFWIIRNTYEYIDNLESNLIATFDYKNNSLIYTYRITKDNVNVIYRGNYNNDNFTCDKELSSGVVLNENGEIICKKIEISILKFNLESRTFFKNADMGVYMSKQKEKGKGDHEEKNISN